MKDIEWNKHKARVEKALRKYTKPLGFGWYRINIEWSDLKDEDHPDCAAKTFTNWQYRQATILFFMPVMAEQNEEQLHHIVLHELCHILLASVQDFSNPEKAAMTEYATESVTRAIEYALNHSPSK